MLNSDLRTREYLTEAEVERLIEAARENRWGHRDSTMLLIAFRHGLRASELWKTQSCTSVGSSRVLLRRIRLWRIADLIGAFDGEAEARQHLSEARLDASTALAAADPFTERVRGVKSALPGALRRF